MKKINKPLTGAFNLPSSNFEKSIHFYHALFGWEFIELEKEGSKCYEIKNAEGSVIGTLVSQKDVDQAATIYVRVESVDALKTKVESLGGSIPPSTMSLPAGGIALLFLDADKNHIVIWEERKRQPLWPISR